MAGTGWRLIGGQRLFFGFAFGLHRSLESETGCLLSGDVLDGCGCVDGRSERGSATLKREDHLADFDLLAFFYFDSFTTPVTEDGTSTTALSVSSSITGWPSETFVPSEIIRRTKSP